MLGQTTNNDCQQSQDKKVLTSQSELQRIQVRLDLQSLVKFENVQDCEATSLLKTN